ncbi:MAG: hypothetical protein O7E55_09255 [Chloroflexi bacterium]|nr:hypothetical protein [Chloroflexota bacterium]
MVMINSVEEDTGEAQFVMARKGTTTAPTETGELLTLRWRVLQGAAVGFHSVQLALAELVDESSELIPNVDVKPLIVNVR